MLILSPHHVGRGRLLSRQMIVGVCRLIAISAGRGALEAVSAPPRLQYPLTKRAQRLIRAAQVSPW